MTAAADLASKCGSRADVSGSAPHRAGELSLWRALGEADVAQFHHSPSPALHLHAACVSQRVGEDQRAVRAGARLYRGRLVAGGAARLLDALGVARHRRDESFPRHGRSSRGDAEALGLASVVQWQGEIEQNWDAIYARMLEHGRLSRVRRPTQAHTTRRFAPMRARRRSCRSAVSKARVGSRESCARRPIVRSQRSDRGLIACVN